jgi:pantetheine-phosphate adenylyltransferase
MKTAVYPGIFDPTTLGHLDLIKRAASLFDHLVIAVASNSAKIPFFSIDKRVEMLRHLCAPFSNVSIKCLNSCLLVEWCNEQKINIIVRGLRTVTDFEYELAIAHANRTIQPQIDTVFLATDTSTSFVSSSLVRELLRYNHDISKFVPDEVNKYIKSIGL